MCWLWLPGPKSLSGLVPVILIAVISLLLKQWGQTRFPPGPAGWPGLGMVFDLPKSENWKTYARWGRQFDNIGIISFRVLSRRIVVVNSREAAEEIFDRRGAIYSDRPFPTMSGLLMKREKSIFLMSYTERLKSYRKLLHRDFNARSAQKYWPQQEHETNVFLLGLLTQPNDLTLLLRRHAGAVILKIAYGYDVKSEDDRFLILAEDSNRVGRAASIPGKWLVDSWPILRFLPDWCPGAGFKRTAAQWGHQLYNQFVEPYEFVKREMAAGRAIPSYTSTHLYAENGTTADAELEDLTFWTAGALYAGGSETTMSAVRTFFFVMILHPEIQRRAQEEVDATIGIHCLPKVGDRSRLPYVDALIKEVLRWAPPVPMALPHTVAEDNEIFGYMIQKGSLILPNLWAMLHDESDYPNPDRFDPTRFLGEDCQPDPRELVFGRGRRVCPGQYIAEASIFIQVASVLATFDVRRELDDAGQEIEPKAEFTTSIVSHVKPFRCRIIPRREGVGTLIEQALE